MIYLFSVVRAEQQSNGRVCPEPKVARISPKLSTLGSDSASSEGYIVRWVEAPSNKLLTTAHWGLTP